MNNPILTVLSLVLAASIAQAGEPLELFNGKDIEGWTAKGGEAAYTVEDGAIVGRTKPKTPNTFLCPPEQFGDFELTFEVKCDEGLNSGVQIRSLDNPDDLPEGLSAEDRKKAVNRTGSGSLAGPQVEIAANRNAGSVYFEGVGGWLITGDKELAGDTYKADAWNAYRVRAEGPRIQVWINGEKIADGEDGRSRFTKGFLGFQVHSIKEGTGPFEVRWRNIRITEL